MIKYGKKLTNFYKRLLRQEKLSYKKALSIYEDLHQEALSIGAINSGNIQDGLEVDIRIARVINSLT